MMQQQQRTENDSSTDTDGRGPGNYTQENFATLVECPNCGVETRVDTPSVGLTNCNNDKCDIRVFILDSTEENKYGA